MRERTGTARESEQLAALSPAIVAAYADGTLTWSQLRERFQVVDFGLLLRRLDEENRRLPRASPDRPTRARDWLREALDRAGHR
jgi:hypothetical protein